VTGASLVLVGLFREDDPAQAVLGGRGTLSNQVHDSASLLVFVALVVAPLLLAGQLRHDLAARHLRLASLLASSLTLILFWLYLSRILPWSGLVQRVFVSVPLVWLMAIALSLARQPRASPP
jgi:hypothetical protein